MTKCYSARCQQDRKLARREFNKWTKNLLFQVGLETISKNHFQFDVNLFHDEEIPLDFNPNQACLFCLNRQEYLGNSKSLPQPMINDNDDDENAPLDLSLKSTVNNRTTSVKQRPFFDIKSDIPSTIYGQEEFDRFMFDMIASQIDYSSQSFFNMPTLPTTKKKISSSSSSSSSQDARIAQLAKQMAYERMLEEINSHRTNKKSINSSSSSILTESIHVNHILHDVMMKLVHDMYDKQQTSSAPPPPRASRKGELLFVKKQNDEQYNFIQQKQNNQSSSSSSTSSISSTGSSSIHLKTKNKPINYIPKGRSSELINSKIHVGMDGKQVRPKRGQYRRYESEQLAKAVAAVLTNEMSVHKAGSYFGVPHSTLEYKVKERNSKIKIQEDDEEKSSKEQS